MYLVWQRFTLSSLTLREYFATSYLHNSVVGLLHSWRQTSILTRWGDAIAATLLGLLYLLSPFTSSTLVGLLLTACLGFWLLLTISDEVASENTATITPIHLPILLLWVAAILATAFSPVKKAALSDLITFSLYLLSFLLCTRVLRLPHIRSWLISIYLFTSLVVSVYGVQQWIEQVPPLATWNDPTSSMASQTRVYSFLGNPNLLAAYILPAIVFSLMAIFVWRSFAQKALAATMLVVNTCCLIYTFSRGGWIGLLVAIVTLLILLLFWWSVQMPPFWRTWALPIILGSMATVLLLAIVFVEPVRDRVLSIFAGRGDSSNNFRINVWNSVFHMIHDYPVFGIGPGHNAFNQIYPRYQKTHFTALSAYSIFLELTLEMGLIGIACFFWLLIVTFNTALTQLLRLRRSRNIQGFWLIGACATMVGMLSHGFVDTVWYRPEVNPLWWLMVSLVASYWIPQNQDSRIRSQEYN